MSVWMGSQSGGWPGGTNMNRHDKVQVVPQVTLQLDVHPPVLDTCGLEVPRKSYSKPGGGSEKQGGKGAQFWNSLRTVYNSICSVRTPVTWVNPEAVAQHHPLPSQFTPQIPYQCSMERMCEPTSDLWYPVQHARSQFDFLDPLTMWQNPSFMHDILPTPYGTQLPQKVCKPLNPEAKEWVPKEYAKDCVSSTSFPSTTTSECLKTEEPVVSFDLQKTDFCEITNSEVEAIRLMENSSLNNIQDGMLEVEEEGVEVEEEDFFSTTEGFDISSPSETLVVVPSAQVMNSHMAKSCSSPDHGVTEINICDNNMVKDNRPLSYASIVGKMASVPEPSTAAVQKSAQNKVRNGPVEQHIPHIFTSDKKYPKEKAAPSVDNNNSIPPLFKKVTRNQKKCSQNFLKELKESSPVKSKDYGSAVIELDLMCSIPEISSPPKLSSTVTTCPMESPLTALPNDKLQSTELKMQRSCSESSSNGSRHRTVSESSITSVESVDIEFGDDVVDRSCAVINICILPEQIQPKCIESKKYSNNALAHILGCDDSESEDSDEDSEDSDSDWDNVCVNSTESFDLDDTWETFGNCLLTPEAGKPSKLSSSSAEENITIGSPVKSSCDPANEEDHTFTGVTLEEINKRWNEDIEKDVLGSRERKVKFGETNIHPIIAWDFAYKMARRGPWEMYARDRMRFQHRIASLEPIISPVLQADHREVFYKKQQSEACCLS
ncbi:uncharacterized protein PPP1R15 [Procambarus clarkii]|uniref:uncharacterized protein PPP1R15 n=1 Tax=Procambarus clarkii TaxID=6728 RepID=UPI001E6737C5|nr:uncharacterized protein LOC123764729 [Procambarus clarkii]